VYASDPTPKPSRITKQQCKTTKKAVQAFIENDEVHPQNIQASLCDTLTITNRDDKTRIIAFGMHDNHISYDGVTERLMKKDGSFTVTLNKSGTYTFHDHNEEDVRAEITIQ
jgi:plastocyanin